MVAILRVIFRPVKNNIIPFSIQLESCQTEGICLKTVSSMAIRSIMFVTNVALFGFLSNVSLFVLVFISLIVSIVCVTILHFLKFFDISLLNHRVSVAQIVTNVIGQCSFIMTGNGFQRKQQQHLYFLCEDILKKHSPTNNNIPSFHEIANTCKSCIQALAYDMHSNGNV